MDEAVLQLCGVSQRFARRWALAALNLRVPRGARVVLTGENGAGKTTLLRLMGTALWPTRGEVRLFGVAAAANLRQVRRRLGLMTHQHYLYEALSARENLRLVVRLSGCGTPDAAATLLERVGLAPHQDGVVATFSAGMKRRLALARLLLLEPELVLLDEPFGQLDPGGVALMESCIAGWHAAGATVVLSTHDVARARLLCSHALHLQGGRAPAGLQHLEAVDG